MRDMMFSHRAAVDDEGVVIFKGGTWSRGGEG